MRYKSILLILFSIFFSACSFIPSTSLKLKLEAAKQLNPDVTSQSLPVRIKIYQLKDATLFHEATFRNMWKSDLSSLGNTILEKKVLTLNPGETKMLKIKRHPQAEYLAVMAIFRRHSQNQWKSIQKLSSPLNDILKPIVIHVANNQVKIES